MRDFESLGQWHDTWAWLLLYAPDHFRDVRSSDLVADQRTALRNAFDELRSGFHFAERKLGDARLTKIASELIEMSFEAYLAGDDKTGAHALQECEGLIWPGSRQKIKYGIEAEKRAFGENVIYAGLVASPFPYEGTAADLGSEQARLLSWAMKWTSLFLEKWQEFKYFSWVVDMNGSILRTSVEPKGDEHPTLRPVQRSRGFKRLNELGQRGQIKAYCLVEVIGPQGDGLLCYDLEESGKARVSARQLFKRVESGIQYEAMRYHLDEPSVFLTKTIPNSS